MFATASAVLRMMRVAFVFARHGLAEVVFFAGVPRWCAPLVWLVRRPKASRRIASALTRLGPGFIKLGQMLATRPDVLGGEMADELSTLQDRLAPFPAKQAAAVIEAEFGRPLNALFRDFSATPAAAASVAQVHKATTLEGDRVAVKVLRPGIEKVFARDFAFFRRMAFFLERARPDWKRLRPHALLDVLERTVRDEMDLRLEASAAQEVGSALKRRRRRRAAAADVADVAVHVPPVDWLRSGRRVLTSGWVEGRRLDRASGGAPRAAMVEACLRCYITQVFHDGFFHADPHPGNLLADAKGGVALVDFGVMGRLSRGTRLFLADILLAFHRGDYRRVAEIHFEAGLVPAAASLEAFAAATRSVCEPLRVDMANQSMARVFALMLDVAFDFGMEARPELLLLQKTLVMLEGLLRRLAPGLDVWALTAPEVAAWRRAQSRPEAVMRAAVHRYAPLARRFPEIFGKLAHGLERLADEGLSLHEDSLRALAAGARKGGGSSRRLWRAPWLWLAAGLAAGWMLAQRFSSPPLP